MYTVLLACMDAPLTQHLSCSFRALSVSPHLSLLLFPYCYFPADFFAPPRLLGLFCFLATDEFATSCLVGRAGLGKSSWVSKPSRVSLGLRNSRFCYDGRFAYLGRGELMPSFDIVSEVDKHHLTNAVDQANRLISTRFDFKGVGAKFERNDFVVTLWAEVDFQLEQMLDVLKSALYKNKIDIACLDEGDMKAYGKQVKQEISVRTGLDSDLCRNIVKLVKAEKLKVQAQVQGDQVRVTGKKRDDLQQAMSVLREAKLGMPLQYTNFRD